MYKKLILITLLCFVVSDRSVKVVFERADAELAEGTVFSQFDESKADGVYHKTFTCKKGYTMKYPVDIGKADTKCVEEKTYKKDGEEAASADECESGVLKEGKCKTSEEEEECVAHYSCASGLFCNNKTCKKTNAETCTSGDDAECEGSKVCHSDNKCIDLFSLKVGTQTGKYYACESGHIYDGVCAEVTYKDGGKCSEEQKCDILVKKAEEGDAEAKTVSCEYAFTEEENLVCSVPESSHSVVKNRISNAKTIFSSSNARSETVSQKDVLAFNAYPYFEGLDSKVISDLIFSRFIQVTFITLIAFLF